MKTIKSLMILSGLVMALVAMSATGVKAQLISFPEFTGSFSLPVQARWGAMTLPAGDYSLYYGAPFKGGLYVVEVVNKEDGSARGVAFVQGRSQTSASKNELVCTREGNIDIVRALDLPALDESINFALPPNLELMANHQKHNASTPVAAVHGLIQLVPVSLNRG
jgi:hypothetical protein